MYEKFSKPEAIALLKQGLHGIEREALRINPDGTLAITPHPAALGSSFNNPSITTDFSESQIEIITAPHPSLEETFAELKSLHETVYAALGSEQLWPFSMPCILPPLERIPIARYGDSPEAKERELYREGLAFRYGKMMQMISGVHYNFSFSKAFWEYLYKESNPTGDLQSFINEKYLDLARNFARHRWLFTYLFGRSPVKNESYTCKNMVANAPFATSLRLSRCGYSNPARIDIDYNSFDAYVKSIEKAIHTPNPAYEGHGINSNLLQLPSEYYFGIRLKPIADRVVQYIEIRIFDLNPESALGIDHATLRFSHLFLIFCLLEDSASLSPDELKANTEKQQRAAINGRDPNENFAIDARGVLEKMKPLATLLQMEEALNYGFEKLNHLPSAEIIEAIGTSDFISYGLKKTREHTVSNTRL